MKTILNLTFCLLVANALFANPTVDTVSHQRAFSHAKQQISAMLSGDKQLSFEEAIYQLENAWYAGGIDYVSFKTNLDFHTQNIRALLNSINTPLSANAHDVAIPRHLADKRNNNLRANYAIYTYLTQHSLWIHDSTITIQQPVQYSAEDPMGTTDWANTHITHLLNEGTGNCFAMAALFKIFADRLGTDAQLCTAPGHIYIRHADENGTEYNVELAGRKFPGTGSIEAITYTTPQAVKNGIAMRALNDTQAVALTMVYLAKARQYGMGLVDEFAADCAQTALNYDPDNLNAMLLKAETMEEELLATIAGEDVQTHPLFAPYQQWLQHIYSLGYRELPQDMKEKLVKGWGKKNAGTEPVLDEDDDTRYASLSWGLFDEQVKNKQVEQYGRTLFNTATQTIAGFTTTGSAYNQYTYDPVVFAWEMDPMAHKMPGWSPYSVLMNSPISFKDPLGNIATFSSQHVEGDFKAAKKTIDFNVDKLTRQIENAQAKGDIGRVAKLLERQETWSKLQNIFDEIINSKTEFHFDYIQPDYETQNISSGGHTHYDFDNNRIHIEFAPGNHGSMVHESRHGFGFLLGEWSMYLDENGKSQYLSYDYMDEYSAYELESWYRNKTGRTSLYEQYYNVLQNNKATNIIDELIRSQYPTIYIKDGNMINKKNTMVDPADVADKKNKGLRVAEPIR